MPGSTEQPSQAQFGEIIIAAARQAGFVGELQFNEPEFLLKYERGTLFLGNLYIQFCQGTREQRQILLANYVSVLTKQEDSISREQAFDQCVSVVRERAMFSFLDLRSQAGDLQMQSVVFAPLTEWFVQCLVIDAPGYMRMVTQEDLQKWEVSFDELSAVGLERLQDCTEPKFHDVDGYFAGAWKDDYDSSRILLASVFESLPLLGSPIFCIPNRLTLLVADSRNPQAIQAMLKKAETIVQTEPRPTNPAPLTLRDGEVVDFHARPDSLLFNAVQRARGLAGVFYYDEQKALLETLHKKTAKDIHVGRFTLAQSNAGESLTYGVWSRGIPILLPKTELVMFYDPVRPERQRALGGVKWEDVEAAAGDLLLDTEMFPPRYYVSKFPTDAQFAAMPKFSLGA